MNFYSFLLYTYLPFGWESNWRNLYYCSSYLSEDLMATLTLILTLSAAVSCILTILFTLTYNVVTSYILVPDTYLCGRLILRAIYCFADLTSGVLTSQGTDTRISL